MPLYEFVCQKCGHGFEELITASELERGAPPCPACKSRRVEKAFSAFATSTDASSRGASGAGGGCGRGGFT